jgi:tRNA G10  N-methylase Trm11
MTCVSPTIKLNGKGYIHPFPARMAPEIALEKLSSLKPGATILDPMVGSGTVLRVASQLGHRALGFDMDPLALLMTKVSTSKVRPQHIVDYGCAVVECARTLKLAKVALPWQDGNIETSNFVKFWFGVPQSQALRKLSFLLCAEKEMGVSDALRDALKLALSRIIITKKNGASLAWDVSHSRPHRVMQSSDFNVFEEFIISCRALAKRLEAMPPCIGPVNVRRGDARQLRSVAAQSVDAVVTSPPYLNAIDYMRGHKLALVWLGYTIPELRSIRSNSIGSERSVQFQVDSPHIERTVTAFGDVELLPNNLQGIVKRYACDLLALMENLNHVLRKNGQIHLVVGDSHLRGVSLSNSEASIAAGKSYGLEIIQRHTREIPTASRYLPLPNDTSTSLGKRMLVEHVLTFAKRRTK